MATDNSLTTPDPYLARAYRDRKRPVLDVPVLDKKPSMLGRRLATLPGRGGADRIRLFSISEARYRRI
jgi:hypothetical protein